MPIQVVPGPARTTLSKRRDQGGGDRRARSPVPQAPPPILGPIHVFEYCAKRLVDAFPQCVVDVDGYQSHHASCATHPGRPAPDAGGFQADQIHAGLDIDRRSGTAAVGVGSRFEFARPSISSWGPWKSFSTITPRDRSHFQTCEPRRSGSESPVRLLKFCRTRAGFCDHRVGLKPVGVSCLGVSQAFAKAELA